MKLQVTDIKGASSGDIEVREDVFSVPAKTALVHQVVVGYLANKRQGTVKTKTRSEVSGGGAKPRPQKGSGRSRQGSTRSPVWVGGGRAFGPTPRSFRKNTPKKMRRLAMLSFLSDKTRQGNLLLVNNFDIALLLSDCISDWALAQVTFTITQRSPQQRCSSLNGTRSSET